MNSLNRLEEEVRVCKLCRLASTRINAVPGEGSINAKLMLVGEAPGRNEDKQGRPFVGSAGKLLDQVLSDAGIVREDVYITNIVKCRPPNNREPLDDEINTCMPYLERQIRIINPLIICILGKTAYKALLDGKSITSDRGRLVTRKGRNYFITIHPAAAIYNPSLRSVLRNDMIILASILREFKNKTLEGCI